MVNKEATMLEIMRGYRVIVPMLVELICVSKSNRFTKEEVRKTYQLID